MPLFLCIDEQTNTALLNVCAEAAGCVRDWFQLKAVLLRTPSAFHYGGELPSPAYILGKKSNASLPISSSFSILHFVEDILVSALSAVAVCRPTAVVVPVDCTDR